MDGQVHTDGFVFVSMYACMSKLQNSRAVSGVDKIYFLLWHFAMEESDQMSVGDKCLLRSRTGRRRTSRTPSARARRSTRAMRTRCRSSRATRAGLACICLDPIRCPLGDSVHQTLHVRSGKQREDTGVDNPQVVDTVDLELRVDNAALLLRQHRASANGVVLSLEKPLDLALDVLGCELGVLSLEGSTVVDEEVREGSSDGQAVLDVQSDL